jgi:hypothetical protein
MPHETQPSWLKPPAASQISEPAYCHRAVVTVVEAARRAMVAGARLGGWREHGATATLVLVRWLVGREEVAEHSLHLGQEQPRATPLHRSTSVASLRAIGRTGEERENGREIENGRERTTREEKKSCFGDRARHSARKHTIYMSLLDARDWSEKRCVDRSTFFNGHLRRPLQKCYFL